jgi:hypothetical protein
LHEKNAAPALTWHLNPSIRFSKEERQHRCREQVRLLPVLTPGCPTQWNMPKVVLLLGTLMEK